MKTTLSLLFATFLSVFGLSYSPSLSSPPPASAPQKIEIAKLNTAQAPLAHAPVKKIVAKKVATTTPATFTPKTSRTSASSTVTATTSTSDSSSTLPQVKVHDFISQVEQEAFALMNTERAKNGLSTLTWNATLASVARAHSADMLAHQYFDHTDQSGCSSACRVTNAGYVWQAVGENIYMMEGYKLSAHDTAVQIVQGWMNSPGHKVNILGQQFTEQGVGLAQSGDTIYITSDYGKQR